METFAFGLHRLVHLDFKGAPPKVSYLEKLFPTLRHWGATGILVEWEDTFPYTNELIQLGGNSEIAAVLNAPYTLADVAQILQLAEDNDLLVIQLIQTIGHMEFVLKCPVWQSLREVPAYPSSMCPSHDGALPLVKMILTQALAVQKNAQYIHIGADEVWHMGMCTTCQRRVSESKHGRSALFLEHVSRVATFLKELRPQLKIIMWDDMLRGMDINAFQAYDLGSLVEPMVWHYNSEDTFHLGSALWDKYNLVFDRLWVASAFKGASGSCQILPVIKHHISNHEVWMKEVERNRSRIKNMNGVALTGWSRYDHYATLCELLPAALPSLAFCLQTWLTNTSEHNERTRLAVFEATSALLGYNPEKPLPMESARFPGWQITKSVHAFAVLRDRFRALVFGDIVQTWLNPWQVQNRFTNPMQIEGILVAANELLLEANALDLYMRNQMDLVYFPHTVEEWHGTNIAPVVAQLQQLKSDTEFQINLGCCVRGMKRTF